VLALTHIPSPALELGERTHIRQQPIDYLLAVRQHAGYCELLRECGVEVHVLDANRDLPDSTFLEDTAVVLKETAVMTSMGAETRRGEQAAVEQELRKYRDMRRIEAPALLEGGDVLRVGRTLLVGLSARSNDAGICAFDGIVNRYAYRVRPIAVQRCLHLKTACTALPDGSLLVNPEWLDLQSLADFKTRPIPADEPWGANTLSIGNTVCLPAEHVQTADLLRQQGFSVRTVPLSEFAKAEGGITCLSLLLD
jgi:dimethylargininase